MRIQSKELNRLAYALNQKYNNIKLANVDVLDNTSNLILERSLAEVPRDTETLASIAGITEVKVSNTIISTSVGYGVNGVDAYNAKSKAMASSYMLEVHEDLTQNHPNGGKAKFLEDPTNSTIIEFIEAIKNATKSAL